VLLHELEDDPLLEADVRLEERPELGERVRVLAAAQPLREGPDPLVLGQDAVELGRLQRQQREDELLLLAEVPDDVPGVVAQEPCRGRAPGLAVPGRRLP